MEQKILELLKAGVPEVDFATSDTLVDDGILDSLSLMTIVGILNKEFDIVVPLEELNEDNFNSVKNMAALVHRLKSGDH